MCLEFPNVEAWNCCIFRASFELSRVWKEFSLNGRDIETSSSPGETYTTQKTSIQKCLEELQKSKKFANNTFVSNDHPVTWNSYQMLASDFCGRQKPVHKGRICTLCKTNGEKSAVYESHQLKDSAGRVVCPVLFAYTCPRCGATGSSAHTINYCPRKDPNATCIVKKLKSTRNSAGHKRY